MELWDLYDHRRQPTGETIVRGEPIPEGRYHIVVHICIFNEDGQMLIQQRQPFKSGWSGMWDITVGGSAIAGETSQAAAQREVWEEIGLKIDLENQPPVCSVTFSYGFDDYYIVHQQTRLSDLKLQPEEVAQVRWATRQEIQQMQENGTFVPYQSGFLDFLFFSASASGVLDEKETYISKENYGKATGTL